MSALGLPDDVAACLFDLDGVLTDTATLHCAAWRDAFDAFLDVHATRTGEALPRFDPAVDYAVHVDGKPRLDGVRALLASRGLSLPEGAADDPPDADTVVGLGARKQVAFQERLRRDGVDLLPGAERYLEAVRASGRRTAVVSSSANTLEVLERTGLGRLVDLRVDAQVARAAGLPGKPAPDAFLHAARLLEVEPARAAVYEDALAGVAAGRAGGFGVVVAVDKGGQAEALRAAGADVVVPHLAALLEAA